MPVISLPSTAMGPFGMPMIPGNGSGGGGGGGSPVVSNQTFTNSIASASGGSYTYALSGNLQSFGEHNKLATNGTYTIVSDDQINITHTGAGTTGSNKEILNAGWAWVIRNSDGAVMKSWNGMLNGDYGDSSNLVNETDGGRSVTSKFITAQFGMSVGINDNYFFTGAPYRSVGGSVSANNYASKNAYIFAYKLSDFSLVKVWKVNDFSSQLLPRTSGAMYAAFGSGLMENGITATNDGLYIPASHVKSTFTDLDGGAVVYFDISDADPNNWGSTPDTVIKNPINIVSNPTTNWGQGNYSNGNFGQSGAYVYDTKLIVAHATRAHNYNRSGTSFTEVNSYTPNYYIGDRYQAVISTGKVPMVNGSGIGSTLTLRDPSNNWSQDWQKTLPGDGYPGYNVQVDIDHDKILSGDGFTDANGTDDGLITVYNSDGTVHATVNNPTSANTKFGRSFVVKNAKLVASINIGGSSSAFGLQFMDLGYGTSGGGGGGSGASPDMSTASYASNFDTANETTAPMDLAFNGDGSKLFVICESTRKIYRYSTPTAYSIASASYDSVNYDFSGTTTALNGFAFNGDGTSFYIIGNDYGGSTPDTIFQFDMSTGYDIANASYSKQGTTNNGSGSTVDNSPEKIIFNNDGTKVYISGRSTNKVHQFSLSSAYDISTISYDSVDLSIGTNTNKRSGMQWGHDGKTLYILDGEGASPLSLDLYTFTTGYDVTTGSYDSTIDVSGNGLTRPQGLALHPDGTNFIIIDGHKTFATAKAFEFTTSAIGGGGGGGGAASYFGDKALFAGSSNNSPGQIDTLDITTPANATNFGSLGRYAYAMAAMSNGTRAVFAGGDNNITAIEYVTFATYSAPVTFGSTLATSNSGSWGSASDGTYGVYPANMNFNGNSLEYITIATTSNGTDFGDMYIAGDRRGGASDGTYGLISGGRSGGSNSTVTQTDRITIATPGNATDFGDNTLARMNLAGMGDGTYAVFAGGLKITQPYAWYNTMEYFTVATPGNATDFGDLVTGRSDTGATNNATRGVIAGGTGNSWQESNSIDYITIATPSNATSFGNLPTTKAYPSGTSGT